MHRFFLPPEKTQGNSLVLEGPEAHHALHVLRAHPGQVVTVLNGAGQELAAEVLEITRRSLTLSVRERRLHEPSPYRLTLLQAIPKGKTMDCIIQKATELGAHRIVPLCSARSVVHLELARTPAKIEKWRAIAIEAMKQCGLAWIPSIESPVTPLECLNRREPCDLSFVASLQPDARHLRCHFLDFQKTHPQPPRDLQVWVGPEGDFSPDELKSIQSAGSLAITLGPQVLRSDTAAIYCLSVIASECQWTHHSLRDG